MKEMLLLFAILAALAIGAIAGYLYEMGRTTGTYEFLRAHDTFYLLRDLRAGDTNAAFDTLESDLDMRVVALRGILDDHPGPGMQHAKNYTNLLRRIAEYRSTHPHHNSITNIDVLVAKALESVKQGNQ